MKNHFLPTVLVVLICVLFASCVTVDERGEVQSIDLGPLSADTCFDTSLDQATDMAGGAWEYEVGQDGLAQAFHSEFASGTIFGIFANGPTRTAKVEAISFLWDLNKEGGGATTGRFVQNCGLDAMGVLDQLKSCPQSASECTRFIPGYIINQSYSFTDGTIIVVVVEE